MTISTSPTSPMSPPAATPLVSLVSEQDQILSLIDALRDTISDADLQLSHLVDLRRRSQIDSQRTFLGVNGVFAALVQVMLFHSNRPDIQATALTSVALLVADHEENAKRAMMPAVDLPSVVTSVMATLKENQDVQNWGIQVIRALVEIQGETARMALTKGGAIEAIGDAMSDFPFNASIQNQGLQVLLGMSMGPQVCQDRLRASIAVQAVLDAMLHFQSSAAIQELAIIIVRNLAKNSELAQESLAQIGAVEAVVKSMDAHTRHQGVLVKACSALRYLAFNRVNRDRIGKARGIPPMVRALDLVKNAPGAIEHVLKAINNCVYGHTGNKISFAKEHGIETTLKIMSRYGDEFEIQEDGCRLLRNVIDREAENSKVLANAFGIQTVLYAVTANINHSSIVQHGCGILITLFQHDLLIQYINVTEVRRLMDKLIELYRYNDDIRPRVDDLIFMLDAHRISNFTNGRKSPKDSSSSQSKLRSLRSGRSNSYTPNDDRSSSASLSDKIKTSSGKLKNSLLAAIILKKSSSKHREDFVYNA